MQSNHVPAKEDSQPHSGALEDTMSTVVGQVLHHVLCFAATEANQVDSVTSNDAQSIGRC